MAVHREENQADVQREVVTEGQDAGQGQSSPLFLCFPGAEGIPRPWSPETDFPSPSSQQE